MISKIVLIGEASVGKSTLRERYLGISFRQAYLQTVGADYTTKEQLYDESQSMTLQIWDLAGQIGFSSIRESYYKGTDGVVLVFDVSKPKTAEQLSEWILEVKKNVKQKNIPIILVGNKIDLRDEKGDSISHLTGEKIAKKLARSIRQSKIMYIESSAKTGEGVEAIFKEIARSIAQFKLKSPVVPLPETDFEKYFDEVSQHIQLFFFKLLGDGPACVAQTLESTDAELLFKMAIYYSTVLGQGANEHTGLFGPLPIPKTSDDQFSVGQSLIYSFKIEDNSYDDSRAKGVNYCFIVVTVTKDLIYQFKVPTLNRFFFDKIEKISDAQEINDDFLLSLKIDMLNNVFILNN